MHQNTETFEKIYQDTYPFISKYVVLHCKNIEDVKDILQDIYLEVYKKIDKQDINIKYIYGIARNKINDYYRFKFKYHIVSLFEKNEDDLEYIDTIPDEKDLERSIFLNIESEQIWEYLKSKKVIISKIFYLYYYLECTILEIALELNISESNVKNYIYRTLKELKSKYERSQNDNI